MSIERYLVLNKYFLSLFEVMDFRELPLKKVEEYIDSQDELMPFMSALMTLKDLKISKDDLRRYDWNIQEYVNRINRYRGNVALKYFQYLPVLFTEIFLDQLKNKKDEFINQLNEFVRYYRKETGIDIADFEENDLCKLAFWMATGSGKTLIMHINYLQFLKYKLFDPDNIILITPNEGLSIQHYEELKKSDIPCRVYDGTLRPGIKNEVLIIEITKLVDEKKDGGIKLPVSSFEGRTLLFVDEGHKGRAQEDRVWASLRAKLGEGGFVFEYSATFGQILSENNKNVLEEYAKSIIFDYSYKYFYLDGYGKDFFVINAKNTNAISENYFSETMFVANLLSFYEQLVLYEENRKLAEEYNLEKPLWIFVGTTVNKEESDILQIIDFIDKVINNEKWLKDKIDDILVGRAGIVNEEGEDIFKYKFNILKENGVPLEDLFKRVFNGKGSLNIYEIKGSEGEFGLKVGDNDYFGVINIGNCNDFKKKLEEKGFEVKVDVISASLFSSIKDKNSNLNVLIGAKKFTEGWDTWRVSSMGLLNVGKGQGPQIIQLFGRGVRLKGKDMSLKRSNDRRVSALETLNIFSIKADYLSRFLEAIKKEEVEYETMYIPVVYQHQDKWKSLYMIDKKDDLKFEDSELVFLRAEGSTFVNIDLTPKIQVFTAGNVREKNREEVAKSEGDKLELWKYVNLFNWERIFFEIIEYKKLKNYWNLIFDKEILREIILSSELYNVRVPKEMFREIGYESILRLEDIAILVLKKYIDIYYRKIARSFESNNIDPFILDEKTGQLMMPFMSKEGSKGYMIQVDKRERQIINHVKKLISDFKNLLDEQDDDKVLPRLYFETHLFVPILLKKKIKDEEKIKLSPEGLNESEAKFLKDLKSFLQCNNEMIRDTEIYLLRNFPKSGVGFQLEWARFYPDFIMWLKKGERQTIVFIDPKGLEHDKSLDNEKILFAGGCLDNSDDIVTIKTIERKINNPKIRLESFILSITPYRELVEGLAKKPSKDDYERHHVLFLDDEKWCEKLFRTINMAV
ncbi:superfamily II DNA or RNA helicase [Caldicoprobacter guelmensis]|uniref:DEAD/DEAH box helicase family protein n=1 Tax=Caldicoprobacter guelmensis TaxID=1170224 RepID=UPI001FAE8DEA|nr:DEAD/DEAH box helicase family protein [Caldicoprobacter guelmensis]MBM7581854.1 superfamily II DNA or RNA helicase [Caldicoprobacter guelmensis]